MSGSPSVLVTGASGFVGRRVVERLERQAAEVTRIDHAWASAAELEAAVGSRPFDRAIHLGWYARPDDYLTAVAPNLRSLDASLELVALLGARECRSLVVAGTCAEYRPAGERLRETDPIEPWSVYGAAKAALHVLLDSSLRPTGLQVTWARLFNLTGPGERAERLVPSVVRALADGRAVDLSPGDQVRDFLDVDDVAGALVHLATAGVDGPVNVCRGEGVALRDLFEQIADRVAAQAPSGSGDPGRTRELLRFGARSYGAHDPMYTVGDASRLGATGWEPTYSTSAMIDRVVALWLDAPTRKASTG